MSLHHPWRVFRSLTEWTLRRGETPPGELGFTCWDTKTVTLRPDLDQAERRSTICHEVQHILRGPGIEDPVMIAREERIVDRVSSRLLVDVQSLGEALAWSPHAAEVADELWVDEQMLQARLDNLEDAERDYLNRRLEAIDG